MTKRKRKSDFTGQLCGCGCGKVMSETNYSCKLCDKNNVDDPNHLTSECFKAWRYCTDCDTQQSADISSHQKTLLPTSRRRLPPPPPLPLQQHEQAPATTASPSASQVETKPSGGAAATTTITSKPQLPQVTSPPPPLPLQQHEQKQQAPATTASPSASQVETKPSGGAAATTTITSKPQLPQVTSSSPPPPLQQQKGHQAPPTIAVAELSFANAKEPSGSVDKFRCKYSFCSNDFFDVCAKCPTNLEAEFCRVHISHSEHEDIDLNFCNKKLSMKDKLDKKGCNCLQDSCNFIIRNLSNTRKCLINGCVRLLHNNCNKDICYLCFNLDDDDDDDDHDSNNVMSSHLINKNIGGGNVVLNNSNNKLLPSLSIVVSNKIAPTNNISKCKGSKQEIGREIVKLTKQNNNNNNNHVLAAEDGGDDEDITASSSINNGVDALSLWPKYQISNNPTSFDSSPQQLQPNSLPIDLVFNDETIWNSKSISINTFTGVRNFTIHEFSAVADKVKNNKNKSRLFLNEADASFTNPVIYNHWVCSLLVVNNNTDNSNNIETVSSSSLTATRIYMSRCIVLHPDYPPGSLCIMGIVQTTCNNPYIGIILGTYSIRIKSYN